MFLSAIDSGIIFVFFLAILVTYIYATSRHLFRRVSKTELQIVIPIMALSSILFALLATFTISNLWNRYQTIRLHLVTQLNQLRLVYRAVREMPNTEQLQRDIKIYANALATTQLKDLAKNQTSRRTEMLYKTLVQDVLRYTQENTPNNQSVLLDNLYTGETGKQLLTSEINQALYLVLLSTAILTLAAFWFLNIEDTTVQFYVDLIVILIIGLALFLVWELSHPFESGLLRSSFQDIYTDFLEELNQDLSNFQSRNEKEVLKEPFF